jgi:hypothetical protein
MPNTPSSAPASPSPEVVNAAIRALVQARAGREWSAEDLAELARLQARWLAAGGARPPRLARERRMVSMAITSPAR